MKDDFSEELQSHLDLHTADNIRAGMTPDEARRQAKIALGGVEQAKERYRERRPTRWLDELMQDLRFATRVLLRDRGFALTVVVVLALGIGANAAIFSVVDALMLRPLPFREPDRLVMIWEDASEVGFPKNTPAAGNYYSWKERSRTFSDIAATSGATANLTLDGPPEFVMGRRVTTNFNRRGELAVRASLGATHGRIVRELVAEGVMLAFAGAAVGLALAPAGTRVLADMVPMGMFPLDDAILDARLIFVTLAIALLTAVTFSLGPALHASRAPLVQTLQQAGRSRMTSMRLPREALVICQIAVAVVLLVGTGLLLRTFVSLRGSELGFRPEQLLTLRTTLPLPRYEKPSDRLAFFDRVIAEVKSLPGVQSAAYVSIPPFGSIGNTSGFLIDGGSTTERQDALVRVGTAGYLSAIGAELVDGRLIDGRDQENAPKVVVINETFANLHWPGRSAVGRRITLGAANDPNGMRTIVGVIRDIRERGYDPGAKPAAYLVSAQVGGTAFIPETLVVRASGRLESLVAPIRAAVIKADPEQPISRVMTLEEMLDRDVADRRQQATLLTVFTSIAVLLSALGLYAVLAYGVAQRRQEIAVRMAVGASAISVVRGVVWGGQRLVFAGLAIGLAGAWAASRAIESLLRGVSSTDHLTFGTAGSVLWAVALLACAIPALRAARVNPAVLLRGD